MLRILFRFRIFQILAISSILVSSSCVTTKHSVYFTDIDSAQIKEVTPADFKEPTIQADDILSINVQTIDPTSTSAVNQVASMPAIGASSASTVGNQMISGYLVDKNGEVAIPLLGKIKLVGLTTYQARDVIRDRAMMYYKDPTVQVRFANYKITIIGEVARPATYTVPNEKVSLLDALGLAGDLTIYGRRDNVLLIRDEGGQKHFTRFNLNSSEIFKSQYFYLRQNDVIYVEPGKAKVATNNAARTQSLALIGSAFSLVIVIISRLL